MKPSSIFPYFLLVFAIFFLSSCSAYQLAQWSQGGSAGTASGMGGHRQGSCSHHHPNRPKFVGSMSGASFYAMQGEYYPFCHKCRQ